MIDQLPAQPADALLALIKLYAADTRADKIDLGVGVYRTADGATPVFKAIKAAEARLLQTQDSKSYLGPEGDMRFVNGLVPHIFAGLNLGDRLDGVQTPGGTGGVRLAADLLKAAGCPRIWLGTPSWPNHAQIFRAVGIEAKTYNHFDVASQTLDFAALEAVLDSAAPGDAVLLHGCCHNPTGADYSAAQWDVIAARMSARGLYPLLDLAYHGLGHGFAEDVAGVHKVLMACPSALVAYSCDKNFGLYRDRVGALYVIAESSANLPAIMSNVYALARANWSMPPDHGGATVRIILEDEALTVDWLAEVADMRTRIRQVRDRLASAGKTNTVDFGACGDQNGLFSTLALSPPQILALRNDHGIYMAGSGRINIAGLTMHNIDKFVGAVGAVADIAG